MMKRVALMIILITKFCFAQQTDLVFDEPIYDFGYIKESEGIVFHVFHFTNRQKNPVSIEKVTSSCGCMVPYISSKTFQPGESGWIKVEYDPTGRPGKFIKSIEVETRSGNNTFTYYVNLRGVVLEKEILPAYTEDWKYAILQIKPFSAPIVSNTDFRFLNSKELQAFINDLTYEIDQNYFTSVKLELFQRKGEKYDDLGEAIFLPVKKFIVTELKRRNYSPNQVGFIENPNVTDNSIPKNQIAYLKISSIDYNNDSIAESGFYPILGSKKNLPNELLNKRHQEDSLSYAGYVSGTVRMSSKKGLDVKHAGYDPFISQSVRQVLMYGKVYFQVHLTSEVSESKIENEKNRLLKLYPLIIKQVRTDLEENGISADKSDFAIPVINVKNGKGDGQIHVTLVSFHPQVEYEKMNESELWLGKTDSSYQKNKINRGTDSKFRPPYQDLPTYQQYINYSNPSLNIASKDFIYWGMLIANELKQNKKINFLIESCASNSPTLQRYDNNYVARRRAKEAEDFIKAWMINHGVKDSQLHFIEPIPLVQGPVYDSRVYNLSFYDKFQYIKIIPVYDTVIDSKAFELFPYQVNFNHNYFELPSNSEVFQVFINRLVPIIEKAGYVKIIIESSASKVPVTNFINNESVAYNRGEDAKTKVRDEIKKRGYDPRRIIIIEQRSLVQGPGYDKDFDPSSSIYEKFQYIKIIPDQLLR